MVENDQLALFCGAFSFGLEDPGVTLGFAMCNMGVDPSEVEAAMNDEVERLKRDLISERELQKLKNQIEYGFVTGNQSMAWHCGKPRQLPHLLWRRQPHQHGN